MSVSTTARDWQQNGLFSPIKIKTPPKPVVRKRRSYSPSWMKRTEMKREDLMSKKHDPFSPRPSDIVAGLTSRSLKSPVIESASNRHELLEQQYQDLRKLMVDRNELEKPEMSGRFPKGAQTLNVRSATDKTSKSGKSGKTSTSTQSEFYLGESLSVKDFLQSNEYGSDHFSKHLSCVKKLAKRYRRSRQPRSKFKTVIEIFE
ncbi:unnamed protein product [Mytilus coruscus]|uniref:Uncharacterized protein n=1 Tax=Mytilus coruscus TaxID=42192 RepID=A0A6J8AZJ3_MYTCO|nr:unnamed protein product [Mytilus coruscus]